MKAFKNYKDLTIEEYEKICEEMDSKFVKNELRITKTDLSKTIRELEKCFSYDYGWGVPTFYYDDVYNDRGDKDFYIANIQRTTEGYDCRVILNGATAYHLKQFYPDSLTIGELFCEAGHINGEIKKQFLGE